MTTRRLLSFLSESAHAREAGRFLPSAREAVGALSIGLLASVSLGILRASLSISMNGYVRDNAYLLALLELQGFCNRYALTAGALITLLLLIASAGRRARTAFRPDPPAWRVSLATTLLLAVAIGALGAFAIFELEPLLPYLLGRYNALIPSGRDFLSSPAAMLLLATTSLAVGWSRLPSWTVSTLDALSRRFVVTLLAISLAALGALNVFGAIEGATAGGGSNVVLITIDTLRADHLASYGYSRVTSPNLDALAAKGVLFERAISQAPWTLPSMASLHTGLYPSDHGAFRHAHRVPEQAMTLAERFRNEGYRTLAVVSHGFVGRAYGFAQGFDVFDQTNIRGHRGDSSRQITDAVLDYLERYRSRPLFLWIHYFDPHYDYVAHEEFPFGRDYEGDLPSALNVDFLRSKIGELSSEDIAYVRAVYDGEIAYTDHQIGRILGELRKLEIAEDTVIAVTADHGEEFFERGKIGHGKNLYDELIRVPLILYDPAGSPSGKRVESPVEVRNVATTLLAAAGIDPRGLEGPDLFRVAAENLPSKAFSEGSYAWGTDDRKLALVEGTWKLIYSFDSATYELYNLEEDFLETKDLSASEPQVLRTMIARMDSKGRAGKAEPTPVRLRDEERKRLEELGYIK